MDDSNTCKQIVIRQKMNDKFEKKVKSYKSKLISEKGNSSYKLFINSKKFKKHKSVKCFGNFYKFYKNSEIILPLGEMYTKDITYHNKKPLLEEENSKNNNILNLNINDYKNMPSFTKLLRKALYSTSDLPSSFNRSNKRSSSDCDILEKKNSNEVPPSQSGKEEHKHEDNQTLKQVISEKINKCENVNESKIKIIQEQEDLDKNINNPLNKKNQNYNSSDTFVMVSTTKKEIKKIQHIINTELSDHQNSQNENLEKINDESIEKNNNDSIKDKISNEQNLIQVTEKKDGGQQNKQKVMNYPFIMVASSWMKDIRSIYKFKDKILGGGNFGTVRKAYRRDDKGKTKYYAIKSISMKKLKDNQIDDLIKEVDIISSLDHPNIVKFYETYHDEHYFHLVMELCQGFDSYRQIVVNQKCDEKIVVNLIAKVLLAIAHCHSRGITHRDLKPENILFENNQPGAEIKIIDFGLSRKYNKDEKMHSVLGTPYYVAPEVLKKDYDEKCDIWSIGAMTYYFLCGEHPFDGLNKMEIFENILHSKLTFNSPMWEKISDNAKSFVSLCLEKKAENRPSAVNALKHLWFKNVLKISHRVENLSEEILLNIKNFKIKEKFKQMIMKYLINTLSKEEIKIFKNSFFAMDIFHNGCIEQKELKEAFQLKNIPITDEEINYLYKILDQNLKGALDYSEFLMAGVNQKLLFTEAKLNNAFKYFDINESGFIENTDLYDSLLRMGRECINTNNINSFIYEALKNLDDKKNFDKNMDVFTRVSKEDFMKIFLNN